MSINYFLSIPQHIRTRLPYLYATTGENPAYISYRFGKEVNILCTHYGIFIVFNHRLTEVSDNSVDIGVHAGIKGDSPLK